MHEIFLTFDTEDFISRNSILGLRNILELLKKRDLTGLFFITGHMAEKLRGFPNLVDLLNDHQIGYHTSSHSVHPTLFEFTDIKSYEQAYRSSLIRETSHINPLTGAIEGVGGIRALEDIFPKKQIVSFRAPGYCWSPPHLEALKTLGIKHDFSTVISYDRINYRGITFYPFTIFPGDWGGGFRDHLRLQKFATTRQISVLTIHPSKMVNKLDWDLIYYTKIGAGFNPSSIVQPPSRSPMEIGSLFQKFDLLLRHLRSLQKLHLIKITPTLKIANKSFYPVPVDCKNFYDFSINWARGFGYKPIFLFSHFNRFFEPNSSAS